jgi:peptidoglycan hydrolase-like protein with peptidoglycan-binding domain/DNA-binding XRE family transcriptional regulator
MTSERLKENQENYKQETCANHLLRKARKEHIWSQGELAERIGVAKETISRWENGVSRPQPNQLRKLCEAFEREPADLGYTTEHLEAPPIEEDQHSSTPTNENPNKAWEPDVQDEQLTPSNKTIAAPETATQPSRMRRRVVTGLALAGLTAGPLFTWLLTREFKPDQSRPSPTRRWPAITYDLQRRLASVRVVQWMLKAGVYDIGPTGVDGIFGPNTQAALIAFQKNHHLQDSGKVDDPTWEQLIIPSRPGSHGYQVIALQERLQALKLLADQSSDGNFGSLTEQAVRSFQRQMHLQESSEADLNTWCLLVEGRLS